jgi:Mlc titration factor MtfA (ptsG expression regulator)
VFDFSHLEAASAIVGQCNHLNTSVQINGSPKASINTHARSCNCNTIAYTPEQYATDPEALRKAFSHVSDLVVNKLVEHLKQ